MKQWRHAYPEATFRESEDVVPQCGSRQKALLVQETVRASATADGDNTSREQRPLWHARGKRDPLLPAWHTKQALFHCDERMALSLGGCVASKHEAHLAAWMPFVCARSQVREASIRRQSEEAGNLAQRVSNRVAAPGSVPCIPEMSGSEPVVVSPDGVQVPLVGDVGHPLWREQASVSL
jgi:hypothetical protein